MDCIRLEHYSFAYPQGNRVLDDLTLTMEAGKFYVLCGCSGCGKSTLLRQFKTDLKPHGQETGSIYFQGKPLETVDRAVQSARIGFVLQDPDQQIVTDKVWHELAFGLESLGYDTPTIRLRVAEMASYFGIQDWFHKPVEELSGGQKQLLNLASIMAMHPTLLILDEPTSQLDPIASSDFLATIHKINQELGVTVLMTEHRLEEVFPMADQVILMDQGKVIQQGTPREVGLWTCQNQHEMQAAMPAPLRLYAKGTDCGLLEASAAPLTVREGRTWLEEERLPAARVQAQARAKNDRPLQSRTEQETILQLEEVWFRYDRELPDVIKGVSLEVKKGELYCLLGGNGTGKSTLLSLISRVQKPYRGKIKIAGKDIRRYSDQELYRSWLGVVPQNPQSLFVKKTVELELYEMIGGPKERISEEYPVDMEKKKVVAEMAALAGLSSLLQQHPYDLSGGEQQRLAIAKILLLRPQIILLDEPTKGLDAAFKDALAEVLGQIKDLGVTILMISHDIEFCAQYADYCGMFFDGNVVTENPPRAFFAGNSFYTTSANRMVRHVWPEAITVRDILEQLGKGAVV